MRIRHVINTVGESARQDLLEAQNLTLETIATARSTKSPEIDVDIVGVHFADEELPVPWLRDGWVLKRSVLDVGHFATKRRLPLLRDLLAPFQSGDFDLGVVTNIDIALQPLFYDLLAELHLAGYDAFTINRRTVHPRFGGNGRAWLHTQTGTPHPGHDCFVFTPDVISHVDVDDLCIGVPLVGRGLLHNLYLRAESFRQFVDLHATFHVGDDQPWRRADHDEYTTHNARAMGRVMKRLIQSFGEESVLQVPGAKGDIKRTLQNDPTGWRPPRVPPRASSRPQSLDRRHLIFAASPGLSGTEYMARLLGTAPRTVSFHAQEPTMAGPDLRSIAYRDSADSYSSRRIKADSIRATLNEMPDNGILVETSHMFVKTSADVVLDAFNHDRIAIIQLHRPLRALLASMAELGWFTAHAPAWRDWLIPPTAPNSQFPIAPDRITGRLDSAIGYILDSTIRTRDLRWSAPSVEWVDVDVERLRDDQAEVASLFSNLRLATTPETWQRTTRAVKSRESVPKRSVGLSSQLIDEHIASFFGRFDREIHDLGVEDVFEVDD